MEPSLVEQEESEQTDDELDRVLRERDPVFHEIVRDKIKNLEDELQTVMM